MPPIRLAQTQVEKLQAAGVPLDYEQIIELHDIGRIAEVITDNSLLTLTGKAVGNQVFYPLTIAASIWYIDKACEWYDSDDEMQGLCLLFAMAQARTPEEFAEINDKRTCRKAVRKWAIKCNLTPEEAFAGVSAYVNEEPLEDSDNDTEDDSCDWGGVVRILQRFYGQTRDHWLNEPADHCLRLINDAVKANSDPDSPPDPSEPSVRALYRLNKRYHEILEAHNG